MIRVEAESAADPRTAWALLARGTSFEVGRAPAMAA